MARQARTHKAARERAHATMRCEPSPGVRAHAQNKPKPKIRTHARTHARTLQDSQTDARARGSGLVPCRRQPSLAGPPPAQQAHGPGRHV